MIVSIDVDAQKTFTPLCPKELPVVTLSIGYVSSIARITRGAMIEVLKDRKSVV